MHHLATTFPPVQDVYSGGATDAAEVQGMVKRSMVFIEIGGLLGSISAGYISDNVFNGRRGADWFFWGLLVLF